MYFLYAAIVLVASMFGVGEKSFADPPVNSGAQVYCVRGVGSGCVGVASDSRGDYFDFEYCGEFINWSDTPVDQIVISQNAATLRTEIVKVYQNSDLKLPVGNQTPTAVVQSTHLTSDGQQAQIVFDPPLQPVDLLGAPISNNLRNIAEFVAQDPATTNSMTSAEVVDNLANVSPPICFQIRYRGALPPPENVMRWATTWQFRKLVSDTTGNRFEDIGAPGAPTTNPYTFGAYILSVAYPEDGVCSSGLAIKDDFMIFGQTVLPTAQSNASVLMAATPTQIETRGWATHRENYCSILMSANPIPAVNLPCFASRLSCSTGPNPRVPLPSSKFLVDCSQSANQSLAQCVCAANPGSASCAPPEIRTPDSGFHLGCSLSQKAKRFSSSCKSGVPYCGRKHVGYVGMFPNGTTTKSIVYRNSIPSEVLQSPIKPLDPDSKREFSFGLQTMFTGLIKDLADNGEYVGGTWRTTSLQVSIDAWNSHYKNIYNAIWVYPWGNSSLGNAYGNPGRLNFYHDPPSPEPMTCQEYCSVVTDGFGLDNGDDYTDAPNCVEQCQKGYDPCRWDYGY